MEREAFGVRAGEARNNEGPDPETREGFPSDLPPRLREVWDQARRYRALGQEHMWGAATRGWSQSTKMGFFADVVTRTARGLDAAPADHPWHDPASDRLAVLARTLASRSFEGAFLDEMLGRLKSAANEDPTGVLRERLLGRRWQHWARFLADAPDTARGDRLRAVAAVGSLCPRGVPSPALRVPEGGRHPRLQGRGLFRRHLLCGSLPAGSRLPRPFRLVPHPALPEAGARPGPLRGPRGAARVRGGEPPRGVGGAARPRARRPVPAHGQVRGARARRRRRARRSCRREGRPRAAEQGGPPPSRRPRGSEAHGARAPVRGRRRPLRRATGRGPTGLRPLRFLVHQLEGADVLAPLAPAHQRPRPALDTHGVTACRMRQEEGDAGELRLLFLDPAPRPHVIVVHARLSARPTFDFRTPGRGPNRAPAFSCRGSVSCCQTVIFL